MKRGLCCLCAVLLCTALVVADTPTKEQVPAPAKKLATSVSNPAFAADQTAIHSSGAQEMVTSDQAIPFTLSNRAPDGYKGGHKYVSSGIRVDCPGATPEGEPICSDEYDDQFNTGCNGAAPPYPFSPITCGESILGTSGTFLFGGSSYRDTDWYQITITEGTHFYFNVVADFDVLIFLIDAGSGDCSDYSILRSATGAAGETVSVDKCCAPGTYYFWVGPQVFDGVPCGVEYCATLTCEPCVPAPPIECPPNSIVGVNQPAYGEDDPWSVFVSNDLFPDFDPAQGIKRVEHFGGVGGQIEDLHWWGVGAVYDDEGYLIECPLNPGEFLIEIYLNDPETNRPDYATGPVYSFIANAASGLTVTDTGHVYIGADDDYHLLAWDVNLPVPWFSFEGWIAIKNLDLCPFWWAGSPVGGTIHVMWDEETDEKTDTDGDLSYCLTATDVGPFTGACCDTSSGVCRDTDASDCVGVYDVWYPGQACDQVTCTGVLNACCIGTSCLMLDLSSCQASGGTWWPDYNCTPGDPNYIDCNEPPTCGITCDPDACFGAGLTGGYLYISWDRGAGDRRHVIDDFNGCAEPITKVHWWGNSTIVWDGPDCDFPEDAPFVIRFYADDGTGAPDINNELCTYDPIMASWGQTDYVWSGSPEWGRIECYDAILAPACSVPGGAGYISIATASPDCDFIWAPGSGIGGQWFYDNGTLTDEGPRNRSFCLFTTIATGACCYESTGQCVYPETESTCLGAPDGVFYRDETCAAVTCEAVPGACCNQEAEDTCVINLKAECDAMGAPWVWLGAHTTCDDCCVVVCDPGEIAEGEPTCFDGYVDEYNYGCFTDPTWTYPDDWLPIAVGDVYCGEMGTYTTGGQDLRDFDWYTLTLTDTVGLIKAHVKAEFFADVYLLWPDPFEEGDGNCPAYIISEGVGSECADAVASGALPAGTYYIAVSCFDTVTCGTPYNLWYEVLPAGKCEIEPDICVIRSENVCLALGGTWTEGEDCGGGGCGGQLLGDANCDGLVNAFDIDAFILAITDPAGWEAVYGSGGAGCDILCVVDCNQDGSVNAFDIDPFIAILTGK